MSALHTDVNFRRKPAALPIDTWFFLQTRPRQEKILAGELARKGIAVFLPLSMVPRMYVNQTIAVETTCYPGYVFLKGGSDEAAAAERTGRVHQIVRAQDSVALNAELMAIDAALQAGAQLTPHPYPRNGLRVKVVAGDLRGIEGLPDDQALSTVLVLGIRELWLAASTPVQPGQLHIDESLVRGIEVAGSDFPPPPLATIAAAPQVVQ